MVSSSLRRTLLTNLRWGLRWGVRYAIAFSLLVTGLALLRGSTQYPEYHATTWTIIASYFSVGLSGGLAVGLLRPLLRWRLGVAVVGWIAGAIVYGGIGLMMDGPTSDTLTGALVLGFICVPVSLVLDRRRNRSDQRAN